MASIERRVTGKGEAHWRVVWRTDGKKRSATLTDRAEAEAYAREVERRQRRQRAERALPPIGVETGR